MGQTSRGHICLVSIDHVVARGGGKRHGKRGKGHEKTKLDKKEENKRLKRRKRKEKKRKKSISIIFT